MKGSRVETLLLFRIILRLLYYEDSWIEVPVRVTDNVIPINSKCCHEGRALLFDR